MSVSELVNTPITLKLGDKQYKVQRLSVGELFGFSSALVVQEYRNNIIEIAKALTGKDKIDYLNAATKEIPKGEQLNNAAMEYMATGQGLSELLKLGLNKCQKVEDDEISESLMKATDEERLMLVSYISGSDQVASNNSVADSDKKK